MRKSVVCLSLALTSVAASTRVSADPITLDARSLVVFDIEGDFFRFAGRSFDLDQPGVDPSQLLVFIRKTFDISCLPCRPGEILSGALLTDGEVDLGVGRGTIGDVDFPSLAFRGSLAFTIEPVVFPDPQEPAVFVNAPFRFTGVVHARAGDREVFRHALQGRGIEFTEFVRGDDNRFRFGESSVIFQFDSSPTPEPPTLLLVGGGALVALRKRRKTGASVLLRYLSTSRLPFHVQMTAVVPSVSRKIAPSSSVRKIRAAAAR